MLSRINEFLLFIFALAGFLGAVEICFRLGRRHSQSTDEAMKSHLNALQAAVLGLLALLLGFNFAMAASRFEARKNLLQEEINSIHDTYLQSKLLPPPYQQQFAPILRDYVKSRIKFVRAGVDITLLDEVREERSRIEGQLWGLTGAMVNEGKSGVVGQQFIESLRATVKVTANRRNALENHVPEVVIHLLFIVAVVALGFIGYGAGLTRRRRHRSTAVVAVLIALVLTIILDLDQLRSGLIQIGDQGITRLQTIIEQDIP